MSDQEGILRMQPSGRWAVCRPGREPVEITSGEQFRVEVDGELRVTRMEHLDGEGYYSIDGYKLLDGMRAAIGAPMANRVAPTARHSQAIGHCLWRDQTDAIPVRDPACAELHRPHLG